MFANDNRNRLETYQDHEAHPVGKQLLNMPWLFEPGEYPKKAGEPATTSPGIQTQPDPETPLKPATPPFKPLAQTREQPALDQWQKNRDSQLNTFSQFNPKPDAWQLHQQSLAKAKPVTPQAGTYPYPDMSQLAQPVSDNITKNIIQAVQDKQPVETTPYPDMVKNAAEIREGVVGAVVKAIQNKQPINPPEQNLSILADAVTKTIGDAYTKDNYLNATNSMHYGKGLGHADDMENPDPDALKGFDNSLRDLRLTGKKIQQFGNKVFDPEGKYLNTSEMQNRIDQEKTHLENNQAPELIDFTKLNWENNPDQVVKRAGQWFRQGFLGTHMFGMVTDAAKGKVHPVANQLFGAISSIAEFNDRSDDILHAIAYGSMHGSMSESWDYMVGQLVKPMPFAPRQVLLFANHVLGKEVKELLMNKMINDYMANTDRKPYSETPLNNQSKGDADTSSNTGETDDDVVRIEVCGSSTYDCEKDRK